MGSTNFKKLTIESFGGIDPDSPITIVFNENFKGATVLSGDQGTNKSSTLLAIEGLLGGVFSDYYINKKSKSVKGVFEFEKEGIRYRTVLTKSMFKFEQYVNIGGKDQWISTKEDKTMIRKFLPYATDPDVLTHTEGTEQLEWIKKVAGSSVDDSDLAAQYKKVYSERTLINRDRDNLKKALIDSGSFIVEAKDLLPTPQFVETKAKIEGIDLDKIIEIQQKEVDDLEKEDKKVTIARSAIEGFDEQIKSKRERIDEVRAEIEMRIKQIEKEETDIVVLEDRKVKGKKFIDAAKDLSGKIAEAKKELEGTKGTKSQKERIISVNKQYEEYKVAFDKANKLTNEIDEISNKRLAMAKSFTPEIEGFEVRLGNIDEEKGLYLNGVNIASLSESERYGLCIQIWEFYKVQVVFIENLSSLGSSAIEIIQMFINNGGTVFATNMRRGQEKISITFSLTE